MEATGVYWKPVWAMSRGRVRVRAGQRSPRQAGPGPQDRRLRRRLAVPAREAGLLRASFVPPKPIRALRNLTRYRKTQIQERAARGQPAAQGARGHRDQARLRRHGHPRRLRAGDARRADRGHHRPRGARRARQGRAAGKKLPALREALEGRFDHLHAVWIGAILAHIDFLDEQIDAPHRGDRGADRPFRAGR